MTEMQKTSGSRLSAVCSDIFEKADDSGACSIQKKTAHRMRYAGSITRPDHSMDGHKSYRVFTNLFQDVHIRRELLHYMY